MKNRDYNKLGFLPGDIFIAALVLLTAAAMFISFTVGGQNKSNKAACIYINGEIFQKISLDKDDLIEINHDKIDMTIEIFDGSIKICRSNCKNQNCVKTGSISTKNQIIACMPNRVYILIEYEAGQTKDGFDAIIG